MSRKVLFKGVNIRKTKIVATGDVLETTNASGIVADGYIKNAQINIKNAITGEILGTTYTNNSGAYSIDIANLPDYIVIEAVGGVDISTNKPYTGKLKAIKSKSKIAAPTPVTPLTTIVTEKAETSQSGISDSVINSATSTVADGLGLNVEEVEQDFIANNNTKVAKKSTQVSTIVKSITETLGSDKGTSNQVAITSVMEKLTGQISYNLDNVDNIKSVITLAAEKTQDDTIIQQVSEQVDSVAAATSIINNRIQNISELEPPNISLETLAKLNAATEVLLQQPVNSMAALTPEILEETIFDLPVYDVYQPPVIELPSPPYTPWTKPNWPPYEEMVMCTADTYINVNFITTWSVHTGAFDPFSLSSGVLRRLSNIRSGAAQSIVGVMSDTTYVASIDGAGRYFLTGAENITWSNGSTDDYVDLNNSSVSFTASTPPTGVRVELLSDTNQISSVSLKDTNNIEILQNHDFSQFETDFYDVNGWHLDQDDPYAVDPYSLGWLDGFNDYQKYTLFQDPVFIPDVLQPATSIDININNTTYDRATLLYPVTELQTSITHEPVVSLPSQLQVTVTGWDPTYGGVYNLVDDYYVRQHAGFGFLIQVSDGYWKLSLIGDTFSVFPGPAEADGPVGNYDNKFEVTEL